MAIITRTRQQMRHDVSRKLADFEPHGTTGVADTGSTVSFMKDTMLSTFPNDHFNGWELTALHSTPESRICTDFTKSSGSVDFAPNMAVGIGTTSYEFHQKFTKLEYDEALNDAIRSVSDAALLDKVDDTLAIRKNLQAYNIPSDFVSIYDVQYDVRNSQTIVKRFGADQADRDASLGTSSISKRSQSFSVDTSDLFVRGVALLLRTPGSYSAARTMTVKIEGDSSDLPDGTAVGTSNTVASSALDEVWRWVLFTFPQRIRLAKSTRYHIVFYDDITTDDVRVSWAIDADAGYAGEWAATYTTATWTQVTTQDHCFAVYADDPEWESVGPKYWEVVPASTRQLYVNRSLPDGCALRVLGYQAPSVMSAETDNCAVSPEYVEAKAISSLCASRIERRDNDGYDYALQYKIWYDRSEILRDKLRTRLKANVRTIEPQ